MKIRAQLNFRNNLPRFQNRVDRSLARPLAAAGNYVRTIMKRRIKKVSGDDYPTARPGGSPISHGPRHLLHNSIMYQVELAGATVAVGSDFDIVGLGGMYHEHGGMRRVLNKLVKPDGGMVQAMYPRHPFAQPALDIALPYLPQEFKNII